VPCRTADTAQGEAALERTIHIALLRASVLWRIVNSLLFN
jgi:hypothetical protein